MGRLNVRKMQQWRTQDFRIGKVEVPQAPRRVQRGIAWDRIYKKLSYCWETVRRESMPMIAEIVEMTT